MESQRSFLIIGLLLVTFLLWQSWQADYGPQPPTPQPQVSGESGVPASQPAEDVPVSSDAPTVQPSNNSQQIISVVTDTLDLRINTLGGDVIDAKLRKFPVTQGADDAYELLSSESGRLYVAQSGLVGPQGPDASASGRPVYSAEQTQYQLQGNTLEVPLTYVSDNGLTITKTFVFNRNSHIVTVKHAIDNTSGAPAQVQQYAQLKQTTQDQGGGSMFMPTYRGAAYSSEEKRYEKYEFGDIQDENLRISTPAGWVGMLEHYFVSAWVPPQEQTNNLYSRAINNGEFAIIGYTGQTLQLAPGEQGELVSQLYLGPKNQDVLENLARGLDLTVDYGILWWLSKPLFWLLQLLHSLVNNWGLAIILITILVKGAMYPLTKAQYTSMAKMRNLQPKMAALKDRYGDDRQKMSQAMMEMYKKEKVNPMGGCFPILLQMPIFLALYWVLLESVELRHAEFALWITDLSVKDPFFVLPILTGASMWLLQKMQPMTIQDPMQQKIMQWMPVAMSVFFLWFPAGLVLYWLISNIITLVQARMIYAAMDKKGIKRGA